MPSTPKSNLRLAETEFTAPDSAGVKSAAYVELDVRKV